MYELKTSSDFIIFLLGNCKLVITINLSTVFIYNPDFVILFIVPALELESSSVILRPCIFIKVFLYLKVNPGHSIYALNLLKISELDSLKSMRLSLLIIYLQ